MPTNDTIHMTAEGIDSIYTPAAMVKEPTIVIIKDTIVNLVERTTNSDNFEVGSSLDLDISVLLILAFLGLGTGLYFLLTFLKKYIIPVFIQRYQKKNIPLFWYRFTALIWLAFGMLSLYMFLKASVVITSLVLLFSGAVFHNFIIDFMLGVYFKVENHIKTNDHFVLEGIEGTVQKYCTRHLKVLTSKSEEIYVPYRNLLRAPVFIVKQVDSLVESNFTVILKGEPSQNIELIQKYMIMCPWIYDPNLFKIVVLDDDKYQISVRVKERFAANKIESFVKSKLG